MKTIVPGLAAALALAAANSSAGAPLDVYGRLPVMETVRISPDGKLLAYVATAGEQRRVVVEDLAAHAVKLQLNAGDRKLRALRWAGPRHLIVTTSTTGYARDVMSKRGEWFVAADVDLATLTQRPLLSYAKALNTIDGAPEIRFIGGRPYAFARGALFVGDHTRPTLFKIDLDAADAASVQAVGFPDTIDFIVGAGGEAIGQTQYDAGKRRWSLDACNGALCDEIDHLETAIDMPQTPGLGRDGASMLISVGQKDHIDLLEWKTGAAKPGAPFSVADTDGLIWDDTTYKLIGDCALVGENERCEFFDPSDQKAWNAVAAAFPGARVELLSFTDDRRKFVVRVDSPAEGPAFAVADAANKRMEWIGSEYADLKPADIAPVRPIAFKAADGLALSGYLTLPRDRPAKALPLVVMPHGGPAARDEPGFDWWAQAMASRGYAVLQVNYRGSAGLGADLLSAGDGQWGRKMQTDLSDGVRHLVAQGTIDPARVCIVGASYGGYAALAGASLDPGVYRCAASVAGPSDLKRFVSWSKSNEGGQGRLAERYWIRSMGAAPDLARVSPADQVQAVAIPILIVHGKDDTVVPLEQSRIMVDALRKAGKPVEFVILRGEDHWLSRGETRLQMLGSVVAFLEKNNPS